MTIRPRRSVLYMPGSNARAIEKARTLAADGIILDLEDSVAPDSKAAAREQVVSAVKAGGFGRREVFIRINGMDTEWGADDLAAAIAAAPDAILVPKVSASHQVELLGQRLLDTHANLRTRLWAMIETPLAIFNIRADRRRCGGFGNPSRRLRHGHQRPRQGDARAHRAGPRPDGAVAHVVRRGGAPLRHRHPRRRL